MRFLHHSAMTAAWLTILLLAAGCATQPAPFDYTPVDEVQPGPGLFSGEDGVFTIYERTADTPSRPSAEERKERQEAPAPSDE